MIRAYQAPQRQGGGQTTYLSFVRPQYRRDYKIPGLEYQTNGIRSFTLWNAYPSVIRIIPGYDKATGEIFRQNVNCNEFADDAQYDEYLSDTFIDASIVSNFGPRKMTFITSYAPGSPESQMFAGNTVIDAFARSIHYSVKDSNEGKRSRFQVTDQMRNWCSREGMLRRPHKAFLMQALVFTRNGVDSKDEQGNPLLSENGDILPTLAVVSVEGRETIRNLMAALVQPENANLPLDANTNNKYGGLAELDGNILFLNNFHDANNNTNSLRPSVQPAGQRGWTPTPWPFDKQDVYNMWVPWQDLLHYMTPEEQCKLLAQDFGPDTVNYIIGTDPNLNQVRIPDEVASAGLGRYAQFVKGGASSQPQRSSYGQPSSGYGMGQQKQATAPRPPIRQAFNRPAVDPVEDALNTGYTPAKPPKSQPQPPKPPFNGLRPNSTMDMGKLNAAMAGLHGGNQSDQAARAKSLLNETGLEDYQDPNFDYVDDNLGDQEP